MKLSLAWAQKLADADIASLPMDEIITLATERLGGIESYEDYGSRFNGVLIARVESCVKHPNADKLSLCKVDDGGVRKDVERDGDGNIQVICGAPNVRKGLLVAWIPPKVAVPSTFDDAEPFVLEARKLRGEISNGMIASPKELGISNEHAGILEVEEDAHTGQALKELYLLDDVIIEIENKMFTHRPDCFGQLGLARELSGIQAKPFHSPDWYQVEPKALQNSTNSEIKGLSVAIETDFCPRYSAVIIDNIKVGPSPIWLQSLLNRVGLRPINNVVDITNYMMMLSAQPLHAFDFDKISQNGKAEIIIRTAKVGESMVLLDGKSIKLRQDDVLITSFGRPIALGGVMGGGNSEVDENTTTIVLESATFDMYNLRKTSMHHGLFTDAVTRFNKGQSPLQTKAVLFEAVSMFEKIVGAEVIGEAVDNLPEVIEKSPVKVSSTFISARLGKVFPANEIKKSLENVEFLVEVDESILKITPPFWRTDIEIAEDIVEEIGRMYGFNRLPSELPKRSTIPPPLDHKLQLKEKIRQTLARAGANEVLTYSFVHGDLLKRVGQKIEDSYAIRNALSPDLQYYRQSLTPSLLDNVHSNIKAGYDEFALFELNKTHNKVHKTDDDGLPGELHMVTLCFASKNQKMIGYYSARRYLDFLAEILGLELEYKPIEQKPGFPVTAAFEYSRSALVSDKKSGIFIGIIGEYTQLVMKNLKLPKASAGFELGLEGLLEAIEKNNASHYQPISKFPSTTKDITLQVDSSIVFSRLEDVIDTILSNSKYIYTIRPLGIYQDEDKTAKNVSFRITLSHHDHTLTNDEANIVVADIAKMAFSELGAKVI